MKNKDQMLKYIQQDNQQVKDIISIKIKDSDDEYGFVGEHYIVECSVYFLTSIGDKKEKDSLSTCLVSVKEFKKWLNKESAIMWI